MNSNYFSEILEFSAFDSIILQSESVGRLYIGEDYSQGFWLTDVPLRKGPFSLCLKNGQTCIDVVTPSVLSSIQFLNPPSYEVDYTVTNKTTGMTYTMLSWGIKIETIPGRMVRITPKTRRSVSSWGDGGNSEYDRPMEVLYGCPSADDVEGLVSESMLTEFEGFIDVEL